MKCWYCKKDTMERDESLGKDWYRCSGCGATHIKNPTKLGESALGRIWAGEDGSPHYHSHPIRKRMKVKQ